MRWIGIVLLSAILLTGCGANNEPQSSCVPSTVSVGSNYYNNYYIGNKNSLKFHRKDCANLPLEDNRVYFDDREQAIADGYIPCQNCNP